MSRHQLRLYDAQHYLDTQWGGAPEGGPIDCIGFDRLTVTVRWKTAGGDGLIHVRVLGTNIDQDAHQMTTALPVSSASLDAVMGDCLVQQQGQSGQLVATWRDLPAWCSVRIDCLNGLSGEGSALRVAVLGR